MDSQNIAQIVVTDEAAHSRGITIEEVVSRIWCKVELQAERIGKNFDKPECRRLKNKWERKERK